MKSFVWTLLILGLILAACASAQESGPGPSQERVLPLAAAEAEAADPAAETGSNSDQPTQEEAAADGQVDPEPTPAVIDTTNSEPAAEGLQVEDDRPAWFRSVTSSWNTNWSLHSIDYDELLSGGPPRDGIPSIDAPVFISQGEAGEWLADNEPVIALEISGDARAYPLQILTWHEIVNDTIGGVPVVVTFCPLCNSAVVFDRRLDGVTYEFGVSGLLRNSDLVMYDRVTESLWQQLTGEAIVGDMTGAQLVFLPAPLISYAQFKDAFPDGTVLSRETGFRRSYGRNPYAGYDNISQDPFLFDGEPDGRLPVMERVVTVALEGIDVAYPFSTLSEAGVIHDAPGGHELVVWHLSGASSALGDAFIAQGEDIGATGVFDPYLDGQRLSFERSGDVIVDLETGSSWNILGQALSGPLSGRSLTPIVHGDHFWFAWAAFKPETVVYR